MASHSRFSLFYYLYNRILYEKIYTTIISNQLTTHSVFPLVLLVCVVQMCHTRGSLFMVVINFSASCCSHQNETSEASTVIELWTWMQKQSEVNTSREPKPCAFWSV